MRDRLPALFFRLAGRAGHYPSNARLPYGSVRQLSGTSAALSSSVGVHRDAFPAFRTSHTYGGGVNGDSEAGENLSFSPPINLFARGKRSHAEDELLLSSRRLPDSRPCWFLHAIFAEVVERDLIVDKLRIFRSGTETRGESPTATSVEPAVGTAPRQGPKGRWMEPAIRKGFAGDLQFQIPRQ
jgi:hypothetical protein